MRIYKSDLQGFLEEAMQPIYLMPVQNITPPLSGEIPTVAVSVVLTAFNAQGRVVELRLSQAPVPLYFEDQVTQAIRCNVKTLEDVRARLALLNVRIYDGIISDKAVSGHLD